MHLMMVRLGTRWCGLRLPLVLEYECLQEMPDAGADAAADDDVSQSAHEFFLLWLSRQLPCSLSRCGCPADMLRCLSRRSHCCQLPL